MSTTNVPAMDGSQAPSTNDHHSSDRRSQDNVMLTIFLCLLSLVVILFILQLYARHVYRRRLAEIRLRQVIVVGAITSHGLNPSSIATLPTFPYPHCAAEKAPAAECPVCLSELEGGELVRLLLNCRHVFHVECIDMWLASHANCPVCRTSAEPVAATAGREFNVWGSMGAATEGTSGSKEGGSTSSGLGSSFRRMLSWERSGMRVQIDGTVDLERQ